MIIIDEWKMKIARVDMWGVVASQHTEEKAGTSKRKYFFKNHTTHCKASPQLLPLILPLSMDFGSIPAELSLWHYAFTGDFDKLSSLISHSATAIDILDDEKRTPLHLAAAGGSASCITYLLEKGANPNAKDCTGTLTNATMCRYCFFIILHYHTIIIMLNLIMLNLIMLKRQDSIAECRFQRKCGIYENINWKGCWGKHQR